jgi:hypothetical protein
MKGGQRVPEAMLDVSAKLSFRIGAITHNPNNHNNKHHTLTTPEQYSAS